jgi:peptide/nickel transport system permease protein
VTGGIAKKPTAPEKVKAERLTRSHFQLMLRHFRRHRIAVISGWVLLGFYVVALFCEFFAPYAPNQRWVGYINAAPQMIRIIDNDGRLRAPFVYGLQQDFHPDTWERIYVADPEVIIPLRFFARTEPYRIMGIIPASFRFIGFDSSEPVFLLGSDTRGRDLISRIIYGSRVSLSIGLLGVALSLILGLVLGSISGYYGGWVDSVIQRVIETLIAIPSIPLWMGLSAALPANWHPLRVYFGITIILSLLGWTYVARVVRGKFIQMKNEDFVTAAESLGAGRWRVINKHLIPNFMSYVIVAVTLSVPGMILAETSLSFLGLGLRAPVVSWGVLLQDASNFRTIVLYPWLLTPGVFVVIAVLAFNFFGDGLRDAADPYAVRR